MDRVRFKLQSSIATQMHVSEFESTFNQDLNSSLFDVMASDLTSI